MGVGGQVWVRLRGEGDVRPPFSHGDMQQPDMWNLGLFGLGQ